MGLKIITLTLLIGPKGTVVINAADTISVLYPLIYTVKINKR